MRNNLLIALILLLSCPYRKHKHRSQKLKRIVKDHERSVLKIWNPEVQKKIDQDIEKHRKADGELMLTDYATGTK